MKFPTVFQARLIGPFTSVTSRLPPKVLVKFIFSEDVEEIFSKIVKCQLAEYIF